MRVAIASIGRFHVLDLARELDGLGMETLFYSSVPKKRAERFGLPSHCYSGLLAFVAPLVAWEKYATRFLPAAREQAMAHALDAAVIARLEPCDVFICMSGIYLAAARHARKRFGAKVWLERGSRHILSQRDILAGLGTRGPTDFIVARELAGYQLADRIVVPSSHVVQSFAERDPALSSKLFVNPYGVDLAQFPVRTLLPPRRPPTVIFVGAWSKRKGVDVLEEAVRRLDGVKLLHVGALVDMPFPNDPRFEHVGPVPQWQLKEFYGRAHVFALASREEGLALVQAQALACGLPLVCTTMTGGADLGLSTALQQRITVVPPNDPTAFAVAIGASLAHGIHWPPPLPDADRALLTWRAYGARYAEALERSGKNAVPSPGSAAMNGRTGVLD